MAAPKYIVSDGKRTGLTDSFGQAKQWFGEQPLSTIYVRLEDAIAPLQDVCVLYPDVDLARVDAAMTVNKETV